MKQITLLIIALLITANVFSAYLRNVPIELKQPDGTVIHCFMTGDEFHRRVHDKDNYTIVQNPTTGYYVYAIKKGEELVSTEYVVGKSDPKEFGILPNLDIPASQMEEKRTAVLKSAKIQTVPHTKGKFCNLVIIIRFADEEEFTDKRSEIEAYYNNSIAGNVSVHSYFKEASYNQLEVVSQIFPSSDSQNILSYKDDNTRQYYTEWSQSNTLGYKDSKESYDRERALYTNAINFIKSEITINNSFDGNADGLIDNITFLVSGFPDGWGDLLWPHMASMESLNLLINNEKAANFNIQFNDLIKDEVYFFAGNGVGVLCHELFHSMGAPDLYHYNRDGKDPVSVWDIMGLSLSEPQPISAYMRYRYGKWINQIPEITKEGVYWLNPIQSTKTNCYKIKSPNSDYEYFVLEFRNQENYFNRSNISKGILITRINANADGLGNTWGPPDEVYVYRPFGTATFNGAIGQAPFSLNENRSYFNDQSTPNCFLSDGQLGLIDISDIGISGDSITFKVNRFPESMLMLDFPNYPSMVTVADTMKIKWRSFNIGKVNLEYTIDGITWNSLAQNLLSLPNKINYYSWRVPNTPTNLCKIRILNSNDLNQKEESKNPFSIISDSPPSVSVLFPNGNETFEFGSEQTIKWKSSKVESVNLKFSIDNGITWKILKDSVAAFNNQYKWIVPGFVSDQCKIRIEDSSHPFIFDENIESFQIVAPPEPSLFLASPIGGESYKAGSYQVIRWSSSKVQHVKIEITSDGGHSWQVIKNITEAAKNGFGWRIPDYISNECRIKLTDIDNPSNVTVSDSTFIIEQEVNPEFWEKANGFFGARINAMIMNDRGDLIASLFKSSDGGETWQKMTVSDSNVKEFDALSKNPFTGALFASSPDISSGIFRSIDHGENWVKFNTSFSSKTFAFDQAGNIYALDVSPTENLGNAIYKSTNNGETWELISYCPDFGNPTVLVINKNDEMFVGGRGIYRTKDFGKTWNSFKHFFDKTISSILIDDQGHIYASGSLFSGGIGLSTDNGTTWELIHKGFSCPSISIQSLYLDRNGYLYAGSVDFGLFRSRDKKTWEYLNGPNTREIFTIICDEHENIYTGTPTGIKKIVYPGNNWIDKNAGIGGEHIFQLISDSKNNLFTGSNSGIHFSDDQGRNWETRPVPAQQNTILGLFETSKGTMISSGNGVCGMFLSKDNGVTWTNPDLESGCNLNIPNCNDFAEVPDKGILYGVNAIVISKSVDDGKTWEILNYDKPPFTFKSIAVNSLGYIFVGMYGEDGLIISKDEGKTWNAIKGFEGSKVFDIGINNNDVVFVAIENGIWSDMCGLYKSSDHGETWEFCGKSEKSRSSARQIIFTKSKKTIIVSQDDGIKYSSYGGTLWNDLEPISLKDHESFASNIAIDQNNYLYTSDEWGNIYVSNYPIIDTLSIPNKPILLAPVNHQSYLGSFIWRKSKDSEKYNLQVSRDPLFKEQLELDVLVNDTIFNYKGLLNDKTYYWKVQAKNADFGSLWSDIGEFSTINTSEIDSMALVALFNQTNGTNWTNKKNWLQGPLNTWQGVVVENGRVTGLNLNSSGLKGPIPVELSHLIKLRYLFLANNQLSGNIPAAFNNFFELEYLYLTDNLLTGSLPDSWALLHNIKQLYLSGNKLTGQIPESWSNLKNLFAVYLGNNNLTGKVPSDWSSLINLVGFGIENNSISELPDLSSLFNLNYLRIANNLLDFGDIEPNIGGPNMEFSYTPQQKFGNPELYNKFTGDGLVLTVTVNGTSNNYQWYKDGIKVIGKTSNTLIFEKLSFADEGIYICKVTNMKVPDLTLESEPMKIRLSNKNNPPLANAGIDQSVIEGTIVSLDGSASSDFDGNSLTYKWTAPAGITLSSTTVAKPTFTAPEVSINTNYTFSLVVNDGTVDSPVDQVVITVKNVNKAPIANAGTDKSVNEGATVSLDASASSDPEGNSLTYKWTAPAGITMSSTTVAKPTFLAPEVTANTNYTFSLVVNNGTVDSPADQVTITVKQINQTPVANAGTDQNVTEGATATLDASASSDPDGDQLTYKWTAPAGISLSSATAQKPTFTAPQVNTNTTFTFSLIVNDGTVDSPADLVTITIKQSISGCLTDAKYDIEPSNATSGPRFGQSFIALNSGIVEKIQFNIWPDTPGNPHLFIRDWVSDNYETAFNGKLIATSSVASNKPSVNNYLEMSTFLFPSHTELIAGKKYVIEVLEAMPYVKIPGKYPDGMAYETANPTYERDMRFIVYICPELETGSNSFKIQTNIKSFPNPTTGIINLEISGETNHVVEIAVCNMMGYEVFRKKTSNQERFQIDISNLVNGLYMMKIKTDSQEYVNKIILQKDKDGF